MDCTSNERQVLVAEAWRRAELANRCYIGVYDFPPSAGLPLTTLHEWVNEEVAQINSLVSRCTRSTTTFLVLGDCGKDEDLLTFI